jgi:hypothetical protein
MCQAVDGAAGEEAVGEDARGDGGGGGDAGGVHVRSGGCSRRIAVVRLQQQQQQAVLHGSEQRQQQHDHNARQWLRAHRLLSVALLCCRLERGNVEALDEGV